MNAAVSPLQAADRAALTSLQEAIGDARTRGDRRPAFTLIAACLDELGIALPERSGRGVSLEQARQEWLGRVRSANRSESALRAYRVAIDDLFSFLERAGRRDSVFREETIVAYLEDYRRRAQPAPATYYRHFTGLRRFFRWLSRRAGTPDPFLDLETPSNPRTEATWLTAEEFGRLLEAASSPPKRRRGLAERDRLVLLALVATGLRRSELIATDWADLDLDNQQPSLLVRAGKGGKARRQPLPKALADELRGLHERIRPAADAPVFCGLEGGRLQPAILANIITRAAERSGLEKHITAHTLRHTAATWLRQETGDARLVAAYLGHADLSTVSRYAHVADNELHSAAAAIATRVNMGTDGSSS
ncbi:MAG TPA: tyrosine-type recombinase/integrase [Gaiellaceae bacterium]|nr:tyrosine-type recombinase/integrase [Gaiellaceae bacterium]